MAVGSAVGASVGVWVGTSDGSSVVGGRAVFENLPRACYSDAYTTSDNTDLPDLSRAINSIRTQYFPNAAPREQTPEFCQKLNVCCASGTNLLPK